MISNWRKIIGSTKVSQVKYTQPNTLRHDFGLSDTRNGFHGSDSTDSSARELSIIFPDLDFESSIACLKLLIIFSFSTSTHLDYLIFGC